jgi:endonuclease/exonuclease/phosphatase family metal-dependent hydrolase
VARTEGVEVRWHLPMETEDRERLDRWCAPVGSPVALAATGPVGIGFLDSLAVISWNSHVGGGDLTRMVGDLRAGRLTGGVPLRHFVLLLQEVHRADAELPRAVAGARVPSRVEGEPATGVRRDIVTTARELGLSLYYIPSMRNGVGLSAEPAEDRGNAILSTLPLSELRAIELPFEAQRRVAVAATIRGSGRHGEWELQLTSAHLDTRSTGSRVLASLGAGRRRQAEGLLTGLQDDVPTVVAGDLNTWSLEPLESAVPFLRAHFPQTPIGPEESTFSTGWGYSRRLDHMFFRLPDGWQARYARVDDRYGSDHHPLLAWVIPGSAELPTEPLRAASSPIAASR